MASWLIYACRTPYAIEVAEVIWRRGEEVAFLVDNLGAEPDEARVADEQLIGAEVLAPKELGETEVGLATAIPLITPGHRFAVLAEARSHGVASFPPLFDPTAVVARTASIGEGTILNAAAVVSGGTELGRFVHLNRSASVGHHNTIEDFATLGPGCILAGHVVVERGAFVGAGAVVAPAVKIGANAVVGAGAVVVSDVPPEAVVVGNPARPTGGSGGYGGALVPA
jgi:sugar O-acyltransferase (sialic acid O-acetyltransferase NeuD family)